MRARGGTPPPENGEGTTVREPAAGGAGRGRPEDDDLVGVVSARLLVAGTPRRERLHALSLLGLLLDHAGAGGRVRVSLDDIVGEFHLPPIQAEQALDALAGVDAVRRVADGLVVVGRQPAAPGGLRLSAFLDNVAAVLDTDPAEPVPAADPRSPVLLADPTPTPPAPAGSVGRRRGRQPALAALALAAVVLLAALGPSEPQTRLRTAAGPPATTDSSAPTAARPPLPSSPWVSWPDPSPPPVPGGESVAGDDQASPGPASPGAQTVPEGEQRRLGDRRAGALETGGPAAAPRGVASAPDPVQGRSPSPVSPASPAVPCPAGAPRISVDAAVVLPSGPDVAPPAGLPTTSVTEVRGTLVNPTRATAVIRSFEVVVRSGDTAVTVPGPPRPVTLAPGAEQGWTVRTTGAAEPGTAATVEAARILDWGWQQADLARACPT